tara:strand:- start:177 stop:887 length:711 start_codon:yes stop_codon:yes gene_type:complete
MRILLILLISSLCISESQSKVENIEVSMPKVQELGDFAGRISKINQSASLLRFKLSFENAKYLNKRDRVDFWDERDPNIRCKGYVVGKSSEYILVKVPEYTYCDRTLNIAVGAYIRFFSPDLINNLKMGRELLDVLLKKKIALSGKMLRTKKELSSYIEKVEATNGRYQVLREKLEAEWRENLALIEEDRLVSLRNYKDLEQRVDDINYKIEQYNIAEDNFRTDRWSLDPRLYYKK